MTLIDDAIYVDGRRVESPAGLTGTLEALDRIGGFAWIGLYRPDEAELGIAAAEFGLHELAVEDALTGHQRAKLDRYAETRFVVLRPARYMDADESVEFGEVHVFVGPNFVIAIRHAESPNLKKVRARLEATPELLERGPLGVLYAIVDQVVDEYEPVVAGLENDIDEIEFQLFSGDRAVAKRIYDLSGEVMELQRAIRPLIKIVTTLRDDLETEYADDRTRSSCAGPSAMCSTTSSRSPRRSRSSVRRSRTPCMTHTTLVAQQQNDEMRRLTETSLAQIRAVQEDLGVGGDHLRAVARRSRLRHELRRDAGPRLEMGVHLRARPDARVGARPLPGLPRAQVALTAAPRRRGESRRRPPQPGPRRGPRRGIRRRTCPRARGSRARRRRRIRSPRRPRTARESARPTRRAHDPTGRSRCRRATCGSGRGA